MWKVTPGSSPDTEGALLTSVPHRGPRLSLPTCREHLEGVGLSLVVTLSPVSGIASLNTYFWSEGMSSSAQAQCIIGVLKKLVC